MKTNKKSVFEVLLLEELSKASSISRVVMTGFLNKHDRLREILKKFDGVIVSFLMRNRGVVECIWRTCIELLYDFIYRINFS